MIRLIHNLAEERVRLEKQVKDLEYKLSKLEKVIKILKRDLDLSLDATLLTLNRENEILIILNEEEYELLKGVFKDDQKRSVRNN